MGNRERSKKPSWMRRWLNSNIGRWYKRRLSKARRRQAKAELRGDRPRKTGALLSDVKTKAW